MQNYRTVMGASAVTIGLALALSACGTSPSSSSSSASTATYNKGPTGGSAGGTLKVLAQEDNPAYDPSAVYDANSAALARLYARQLYSYQSSNDPKVRATVVPDLADGMPTVSKDGKTYTIKIKQGVKWDVDGGRQVTADDAILGLKMVCNPAASFGGSGYFTAAIQGEDAFCTAFGKVSATKAAAIKSYAQGNSVSGLKALDSQTLQITLTSPTSDFLHFLALTAASPEPVESLNYVPDSPDFRHNIVSDGPYKISSYVADKSVAFVRNDAWSAATDNLRKAYADQVDVTIGGTPEGILQQLQANSADTMLGNDSVPNVAVPGLLASGNTGLHINPTGGNAYLIFNMTGGSTAGKNLQVRQALNYAVNKLAVAQTLGGVRLYPILNQIFTSSVVGTGYKAQDPYPSKDSAGDVTTAKKLLADAGYPNGLTLKLSYYTANNGPKIATTLQSSLKAVGINLSLKGVPNSDFGDYLTTSSNAKSGDWDVMLSGWNPDWEGAAERSFFTPLLDGRTFGDGSLDSGDYNSAAANKLADQALAATTPAEATDLWNQVDTTVMNDAPWVPIVEANQVNFVASRVKNFEYSFTSGNADLTDLAVQ